MARRRTKSVRDLQDQLNRIVSNPRFSFSRSMRIAGIYNRYRDNIQRALGYSNSGKGIDALNAANTRFSNPKYQSLEAINKAQVSRRVYMGLSNG